MELDDSVADGALDLVNTLIGKAVNDRASDVHLDPQERNLLVRFRVDGVLRETEPVDRRLHSAVAARIKVMAQLDIAEKRMPQDGSFVVYISGLAVDVRVAVVPTKHGEQIVLRLLQRDTKLELPGLGMNNDIESAFLRAIDQPYGAVFTCGPTGSGKTTTLYAALDRLNNGSARSRRSRTPSNTSCPASCRPRCTAASGSRSGAGSARSCAPTRM